MSYHTHFYAQFNVQPAFTVEQINILRLFTEARHEGDEFPDYPYCQWVPCEDGSGIRYTEDEISSYHYNKWLAYIIECYIKPWGLRLDGQVTYEGEDATDQGTLYVHNNQVADVPNQIVVPPNPFRFRETAPPSTS